jgi:hypothetical protein
MVGRTGGFGVVADYSSWSHEDLHDAVMAADPDQMQNASAHWLDACQQWQTINSEVATHTQALMPSWSGPAARGCYSYTTNLLLQNGHFQQSLYEASDTLFTLAAQVRAAQQQMPPPPDVATQAAAAGEPNVQQIADYIRATTPPSTLPAAFRITPEQIAGLVVNDPTSPAFQGAVSTALQKVTASHAVAVQVATTLAGQYQTADQRIQTIHSRMTAQQGGSGIDDSFVPNAKPGSTSPSKASPSSSVGSSGASSSSQGQSSQSFVSQGPPSGSGGWRSVPSGPSPTGTPPGPYVPPSGPRGGGPLVPTPNPNPNPAPSPVPIPSLPGSGPSHPQPPVGNGGLKDYTPPSSNLPTTPPTTLPGGQDSVSPTGGGWSPNTAGSWGGSGVVGGWSPATGWGDGITGGTAAGGVGSPKVSSAYGDGETSPGPESGSGSGSGSGSEAAAGEAAAAAGEGEAGMPMGMMPGGAGGGGDSEQRGQRPAYLVTDNDEYWTGSKVKRAAPAGGVIE